MTSQITQLAEQIYKAKLAYYNNEPIISDEDYDKFENQLRNLDPDHPILKQVGAPPINGHWPKVKHSIPMGSLNKATNDEELQGWFKNCGFSEGKEYVYSEKLDGFGLSIKYLDGFFVQALTRGDGIEGEDVTKNTLKIPSIPKRLPIDNPPHELYVRGEGIVTHSNFKSYFQGDSNPRNSATGTLKRQTGNDKCQHLTFKAYYLSGMSFNTKSEMFSELGGLGFEIPQWGMFSHLFQLQKIYQEYIQTLRDGLNYDIDGLVLEPNDSDLLDSLGELNNRPKGAVAFKFPPQTGTTTLRNIDWQMGNSGRLTPVALFDPVTLSGAAISKATLHNLSYINTLSHGSPLGVGAEIVVSRRGDVIPAVECIYSWGSPNQPLNPPKVCPICNQTLEMSGEYLVCPNPACSAKNLGKLSCWINGLGVLNFGDTLIEFLAPQIKDLSELYVLDPAKIAGQEMNGRKIGEIAFKAFSNLHAKKDLTLPELLGNLNIPMIGKTMVAAVVNSGFDSLEKIYNASVSDIAAIPGMGEIKAQNFVDGIRNNKALIQTLLNHITIKEPVKATGNLAGKTFCLTGFRDGSLQQALENAGGTMKNSVVKNLDFLICLDKTENSSKLEKARNLSILILTKDEAWELLK